MRLLLNADVGEGLQTDAQLIPYLDQASIACGGHTGNEQSMQETVARCVTNNVQIGAHPSYQDRDNFGRKSMSVSQSEIVTLIRQQTEALHEVCAQQNTAVTYIKPHGALYSDMMVHQDVFAAVLEGVASLPFDLKLMVGALPSRENERIDGKRYLQLAKQVDVEIMQEVFADRAYLESGLLCPRGQEGAVFGSAQAVLHQANSLAGGYVEAINGARVSLQADSLCLHGDNPVVLQAVAQVAAKLKDE